MKEELTAKMHSEFTVDEKTDLKHRVWSLLGEAARRGLKEEELMPRYQITAEEIERHRESYLRLKRKKRQ